MDRMQIGFVLGMNALGIPIQLENYQLICDNLYKCKALGIHISPSRIEFDGRTGHAYSPRTHEDGGYPSRSLLDDIIEVRRDIDCGIDDSLNWKLDNVSMDRLRKLKTSSNLI
jgi:hypothetical protein